MTAPSIQPETAATQPTAHYYPAIGALRGFTVALVVAHHAALAYHPYAPPLAASLTAQPRWWQAFPVLDTHRWDTGALLVGFNDIFFMALMFFLSGLFVARALQSRGPRAFFTGRLRRLGVPFVLSAAILAPIAYYPAFLQSPQPGGFWHTWLSLGQWPAGPAWFLWVLLAFDALAALVYRFAPKALQARVPATPGRFFLILTAFSAVAYIPLALIVSPMVWSAFGPFTFQTSRILHYLAYFVFGILTGAAGLDQGILSAAGALARRWGRWSSAAGAAFALSAAVSIVTMTAHPTSTAWIAASNATFVLSCACSCFCFLAVFLRFAHRRSRFFDSLSANSFGIYLLHYAFVSWLQYALLPAALPGFAKFTVVFTGAVALSWSTSSLIRRWL